MSDRARRARVRCTILPVAALLLAACGSGAASQSEPAAEGPERVAARNVAFAPRDIEVSAGDTVTWTNEDSIAHTVTSGRAGEQEVVGVSKGTAARPDGVFDGPLDRKDATFSFTFERPGTYSYYCAIHPPMTGTVVVAR